MNVRTLPGFLPFRCAPGEEVTCDNAVAEQGKGTPDKGLTMTSKLIVPLGLAASCIAHLAILGPALILSGGSPFDARPADAITVDIVSSEEIPQPADESARAATTAGEAASSAAAPPPPPPGQPDPRATRQPSAMPQTLSVPPSVLPQPPFVVPQPPQSQPLQPDEPGEPLAASMFGMPMAMPDGSVGGRFDQQAMNRADIANDAVAAFRNHLKTCSKLPAGIASEVRVVLRVYLNPDGTLAAGLPANPEPIRVEGVSAGGGALFQSAVAALRKCQPYEMLPPDRYPEWKTLDLAFTPQTF
jgi:hypothetical protein